MKYAKELTAVMTLVNREPFEFRYGTGGKRFVIINSLPYMYDTDQDGTEHLYKVKLEKYSFTIGTEVENLEIPERKYTSFEIAVKLGEDNLNSIGDAEE